MRRPPEVKRSSALVTGALLSLAVVLPVGIAAQATPDAQILNRMHDEAVAVAVSSGAFSSDLRLASDRHAQVANARTPDDPRLVECLQIQAALSHAVGDLRGALDFSVRAADHARATGDILNAATAYTDAAILAQTLGDGAKAADLANRARLLAQSPHLDGAQSAMILNRITDSPTPM